MSTAVTPSIYSSAPTTASLSPSNTFKTATYSCPSLGDEAVDPPRIHVPASQVSDNPFSHADLTAVNARQASDPSDPHETSCCRCSNTGVILGSIGFGVGVSAAVGLSALETWRYMRSRRQGRSAGATSEAPTQGGANPSHEAQSATPPRRESIAGLQSVPSGSHAQPTATNAARGAPPESLGDPFGDNNVELQDWPTSPSETAISSQPHVRDIGRRPSPPRSFV